MGWGTRGKGGRKGLLGEGDGTRYVCSQCVVCLKKLSHYVARIVGGGVNSKIKKDTTGEVRTELSYHIRSICLCVLRGY